MQSLRILVVDDEEDILEIFRSVLEEEGHAVATAETGEVALAQLGTAPFDLVFLDIKLPGLSGIDVLKEIRTRDALKPKVVMITGVLDDDVYDLSIYSSHAANGFVTKPCSFQAIKDCIRKVWTEDASFISTPRNEFRHAADKVQKALHQAGQTLATVEVMTAGNLAEVLSKAHQFGAEYRGGLLLHGPGAIAAFLDRPAGDLKAAEVLGEAAARTMAERVRARLGTDLGLALVVHGEQYPGDSAEPLGQCSMALAGPRGTACASHLFATRQHELLKEASYFALVRFHALLAQTAGQG